MQAGTWPNPPYADEYAVRCDAGRAIRLLIVPALFDEASKLRHFTVETMRVLDRAGIDTMLPDLPGTNESLQALADQSLESWRAAIRAAARHFGATHVLTMRGGALCSPSDRPTLCYAPTSGPKMLKALLRAQVVSDREAGRETTREGLLEVARSEGAVLAGFKLSAEMVNQLEKANTDKSELSEIAQGELGGPGLWLRAEPDHDAAQAEALAKIVLERLA